jgi:hypothetical protein
MKELILALSLLFVTTSSIAKDDYSLTVYDTYEAYKNKKGTQLYEFIGFDWTLGLLHVYYKVKRKGKDELRKNVTNLYGFRVGDQFYRIVKGKPYRVLMEGKIVYYENGLAHLNMLIGGEDEYGVEQGGWHLISDNLNSEVLQFPSNKAEHVFGGRTELQGLFECVEKLRKKKTEKVRACVKANN